MPTLFRSLLIAIFLALPASADPEKVFRSADEKLEAGDYEAARDGFAKLVEDGEFAPEVFFGLGNSHYRLEDSGRAALAYRRALFLEPAFSEARQNLQFLTENQGLIDTATPEQGRGKRALPESLLMGGIVGGIGIALLAVFFLIALQRKPRWLTHVSTLALLAGAAIATVSSVLAFQRDATVPASDSVVVVGEEASARSAPAKSASEIIDLPAGSLLSVDAVRGSWSYVNLPSGLKGWVDNTLLETIWPYDQN